MNVTAHWKEQFIDNGFQQLEQRTDKGSQVYKGTTANTGRSRKRQDNYNDSQDCLHDRTGNFSL